MDGKPEWRGVQAQLLVKYQDKNYLYKISRKFAALTQIDNRLVRVFSTNAIAKVPVLSRLTSTICLGIHSNYLVVKFEK